MVAQICHFSAVTIIISIGAENQQWLFTLAEALTAQWKTGVLTTVALVLGPRKQNKGMKSVVCVFLLFVCFLVNVKMPLCNDRLVSSKRKIKN